MVEGVFIEVTLWADEYVLEEAAEVFAELNAVVYFHSQSSLVKRLDISQTVSTVPVATQPCGHVACWQQNKVSEYRRDGIIKYRETPLDNRITPLFPCLLHRVLDMAYIVLLTERVEHLMRHHVGEHEHKGEWQSDEHQC